MQYSFDEQYAMWSSSLAQTNREDLDWERYDSPWEEAIWKVYSRDAGWDYQRKQVYRWCIKVDCPRCKVLVGDLCINLTRQDRYAYGRPTYWPHKERRTKTRRQQLWLEEKEQRRQKRIMTWAKRREYENSYRLAKAARMRELKKLEKEEGVVSFEEFMDGR